jgi:uncharacterized membrane protein
VRRLPAPLLTLWAAIAAYGAGFAALSVLRQDAFATGRFDLGNMVQAVWWTAHGRPLQMTNLHGDQISRLAAHVDPVLAVFGPLWWIWPSPDLLLVTQALAIAAGAWPLYRLAQKHLESSRAALGFALAYLLYPATGWLTLNEFHPVALATPLLLFAFWYLDNDRLLGFGLCAAAAAACKEEIGLVAAGFGVWYAFARGRLLAGTVIAALGVTWSALAIAVVIPHFHTAGESDFYGRYSEVGGSAAGIAKTAFTHPLRIFDAAFSTRDLRYLLELALPLAALSLLAPLVLVAALPELAINLLSATPTQTSIHFHYTAGLIPPLMIAAVLGAKRLRRWAVPVAMAVVLAALLGNYRLGPIPGWRHVPGGARFQATVGAAPHPQLSVHPGRDVDRRGRDAARLRRPLRAPTDRDPARCATAEPRLAPRLRAGRRPRVQPRAGIGRRTARRREHRAARRARCSPRARKRRCSGRTRPVPG